MKIGGIGNNAVQPANNNPSQAVDTKSKEIQTQITNAQNKLQQISSNQNLSDEEKNRMRQEIQKQISELNNRLRKHQLEMRQQQQQKVRNTQNTSETRQTEEPEKTNDANQPKDTRQADDTKRTDDTRRMQNDRIAQDAKRAQDTQKAQDAKKAQAARQLQDTRQLEDIAPPEDSRQTKDTQKVDVFTDKSNTDESRSNNIPAAEMKAVVSANTAVKHASAQGQVSTSISSKAHVLEGEIRQDALNDRNIKSKNTELETLEQKAATASSAQLSILSDASGEVRRVKVKDNVSNMSANINQTNQTKPTHKPAQVATGVPPEKTMENGKINAYSKGKMFSSVNFSF